MEEFKKGDIVVFMPDKGTKIEGAWDREMILEVHCASGDLLDFNKEAFKNYPHWRWAGGSNYKRGFRHATQDEINQYKGITVENYEVF